MQHAIINAMKCMRAIKDRIARPVVQLEIISIEPTYHAQQVSRWKSSVRDLQDPSAHHSSVVFRHDKSVGHHSDYSVGLFRHDKSVGQSQSGEHMKQTSPESFEHQQLHASTPALIQGLKWVANERAKLGELSATKILKNKGWKRRESTVESYDMKRRRAGESADGLVVDDVIGDVIIFSRWFERSVARISRSAGRLCVANQSQDPDASNMTSSYSADGLKDQSQESAGSLHPDARRSDVVEELSSHKLLFISRYYLEIAIAKRCRLYKLIRQRFALALKISRKTLRC
ncbi:hypothetical protein F511_08648 [Dorcoceras hygrometricum]|uniref:Uncharacterized protein n=1 Tax=Dorcoceras hygrometricum TaxID=472368 RepID=A0A2Z7B1R9_9LAMI|nr:hypothetical protein F511_08648 [Dorcoceras hygrometricum]